MLRLVLGVLADTRRHAASLALLAVLALAAGTAAPLYAAAADRQAVLAEVSAATPVERSVAVTAQISSSAGAVAALAEFAGQVRAAVPQPELTGISGGWVTGRAVAGDAAEPVNAWLTVRDDVCAHLALSGACPDAADEVVLSVPTAQHLELDIGYQFSYRIDGRDQPVTLRVVGTYDPAYAPADPYWAGRREVAPQPMRVANPIFTVPATIQTAGLDTMVGTVDLVAGEQALTPASVTRLAPALAEADYGPGVQIVTGLPQLLTRIESTRRALAGAAPLGALHLLVLSWLVLLLAAGYAAAERRTETALGTLRGAPTRHRALFALGPTALVLVAAAPFGFGLGWLLVRAITWASFTDPGGLPITWATLASAGATLVGVLLSAALAERRAHAGPLLDALREVAPRRATRAGNLVELGVIVLASAAVAQSLTDRQAADRGLPLFVPLLLALVAGILAARAVQRAAAALGRGSVHRGNLAVGLAAIQFARRGSMERLVTLSVVALVLVGFAASAWDVLGRAARERAAVELGAQRVLTVHAASRPALLSAVRAADPDGAWAMAVARQRSNDVTVVAVDSSRLAAVAHRPGDLDPSAAAQVAAALRPPVNAPVQLTGAVMVVELTVREALERPLPVTVALTGPRGEAVTAAFEVAPEPGPQQHRIELPECARPPGCRLAWLSFTSSPHRLVLQRIGQLAPERTLLVGPALAAAARWRPSIGAENEVRIHGDEAGVTLRYSPPPDSAPSADIRLQVSDAPVPLPVTAAGPAHVLDTRQLRVVPMLGGQRQIEVVRAMPVLPGIGGDGILADLEYADRISDQRDNYAELQVWLGPEAPMDATERLRAAGLVPLRDETVDARATRYRMGGGGLGLLLQLVASALAVLLAALAVLVLAATDRTRRAMDLVALRAQGVGRRTVTRAIHGTYLGMVGVAIVVGVAAAGLAWLTGRAAVAELVDLPGGLALPGPRLAVVVPALVGGGALLLGAALLAGRGLTAAVRTRLRDAAGARA